MSNNISTMYTKSQNLKAGRKGYVAWKTEKKLLYLQRLMVIIFYSIKKEVRKDEII